MSASAGLISNKVIWVQRWSKVSVRGNARLTNMSVHCDELSLRCIERGLTNGRELLRLDRFAQWATLFFR